QSLQLLLGWWVHLPGLTGIKRPTGIVYYVFHTDTWEDRVEFENTCLWITAHDTYIANHHQFSPTTQSIVPSRLLLIIVWAAPSGDTGYVLNVLRETALLLYHDNEHLVGK